MKCLAVLVILLFAALPVFADSIAVNTFALQANPIRLEALGPGLDPVLAPMVIYGEGRGLVFDTSLGPIGSVCITHLPQLRFSVRRRVVWATDFSCR